MKIYSKLLAAAYFFSVAMLLLLEFTQFQEVDRLRVQISQSYELISGRDEGVRLELEYRRLRGKLAEYVFRVPQKKMDDGQYVLVEQEQTVDHQEVMVWFDIFWSRVFGIRQTSSGLPEEHANRFGALVDDMRDVLREIDPLVRDLQPGDWQTFETISAKLASYSEEISDIATTIAQVRVNKAAELQQRLNDALVSMDSLFLTSAAGMVLILTLFGTEAFRARREEGKIKSREARVRFLAEHDSLTGLGNRSYLNQKMAQFIKHSEETGEGFTMLLLDLDKFKDVNDTHGHPIGDRLLKKAAARLTGIFSATHDTIARIGGDEFAVLTRMDLVHTELAANRVIDALSSAFELSGNDIRISTSIGISRYPDLSHTAEELLRDADLALYEAKNRGRQTYYLYEPTLSVAINNRVRLESDLRMAIQQDGLGLEVYYQPQVTYGRSSDRYHITGVEALVRWFHPEQGQIPTIEFIEIAENAGLIGQLSDWIVRQACLDVVSWHNLGYMINLSVNLSPFQLNNPKLPEELNRHLDHIGLDPAYLTLEITESADVRDTKAATELLSQLTDRGISLAMDDFGTGYSNLGYLKSLPLDTLKIDRSFVMQIEEKEEDRKLVRGIINLAQGMGLKVVAEGVETIDQVAFLRAEKCDTFQGYLYGHPMHKLAIMTMLAQSFHKENSFADPACTKVRVND
ncbi:EAL domain-containing protein [uncultured Cohaesibacter sp.]|uniref:putative bifunctional diguanylate cyclase/phosphodiesterase n=1 Tax=uncultured Cohaesibacter sp. TaxID=1002546 RepID=UPI00292CD460|nr:EAL domain-containing protein [uncultured Cohaesibacter sp.]